MPASTKVLDAVSSPPLRLVFDTNVVIDIFRFRDPSTGPLAKALEQGQICCLTDEGCLEELRRVLAYPKLKMDEAGATSLWNAYAARAEHIPGSGWPEHLPQCRDQDDQRFIELAARGRADWLVSKDKLVLKVRRSGLPLPFEILRPDEAMARLAALTAEAEAEAEAEEAAIEVGTAPAVEPASQVAA